MPAHPWPRNPIAETLLVPLRARAAGDERAAGAPYDPHAAALVERLGRQAQVAPLDRLTQVGLTLRSRAVDDYVRRALAVAPGTLVIELGCGLDTRYERLDNGQARWLEIDLPEVIEVRREHLAESPQRRMVRASAWSRRWHAVARRMAGDEPILFVAEGVLIYFSPQRVARLLRRLSAAFPGARMIFDSGSPAFVRLGKHVSVGPRMAAPYRWSLRRVEDLHAWRLGLRVLDSQPAVRFGQELRRLPLAVRWTLWTWPGLESLYRLNLVEFGGADDGGWSRCGSRVP